MLENLCVLLFDLGLLTVYSIVGFVVALLIQGIVYRITGFSIYNFLVKKFIVEEL